MDDRAEMMIAQHKQQREHDRKILADYLTRFQGRLEEALGELRHGGVQRGRESAVSALAAVHDFLGDEIDGVHNLASLSGAIQGYLANNEAVEEEKTTSR